jgi:hypothetical protein
MTETTSAKIIREAAWMTFPVDPQVVAEGQLTVMLYVASSTSELEFKKGEIYLQLVG